jgi:hypothetical protein
MEYIFHPPPILAEIFAVPRPPAGTLAGATVIESETGDCADAASEHTETVQNKATKTVSVDLKSRIGVYAANYIVDVLRPRNNRQLFINTNNFPVRFDA